MLLQSVCVRCKCANSSIYIGKVASTKASARPELQLLDRRRRLKRRAHFTTWLTSLSDKARVGRCSNNSNSNSNSNNSNSNNSNSNSNINNINNSNSNNSNNNSNINNFNSSNSNSNNNNSNSNNSNGPRYCTAINVTTAFVFAARRALRRSRRASNNGSRRLNNCGCTIPPSLYLRYLDSTILECWTVKSSEHCESSGTSDP